MFIGVDLVDIDRMTRAIQNPRFVTRIFTAEEQKIAGQFHAHLRVVEFLAGRFAAKEAAFKALSAWYQSQYNKKVPAISFQDIATMRGKNGLPELRFGQTIETLLKTAHPWSAQISISHTRSHALASVLLQATSTQSPLLP